MVNLFIPDSFILWTPLCVFHIKYTHFPALLWPHEEVQKVLTNQFFPPMEEPTVLPEDWELLSSLPLILQPLVDEIAMCWDPVFHEGGCMCMWGVYMCVNAAQHDWLYVCVRPEGRKDKWHTGILSP